MNFHNLRRRLGTRIRRAVFGPPPQPAPRTTKMARGGTVALDYDMLRMFAAHSERGYGDIRPSYGVAELARDLGGSHNEMRVAMTLKNLARAGLIRATSPRGDQLKYILTDEGEYALKEMAA